MWDLTFRRFISQDTFYTRGLNPMKMIASHPWLWLCWWCCCSPRRPLYSHSDCSSFPSPSAAAVLIHYSPLRLVSQILFWLDKCSLSLKILHKRRRTMVKPLLLCCHATGLASSSFSHLHQSCWDPPLVTPNPHPPHQSPHSSFGGCLVFCVWWGGRGYQH